MEFKSAGKPNLRAIVTGVVFVLFTSTAFAQDAPPAAPTGPNSQVDNEGSGSGEDCEGVKCLRPIADYIKSMGAAFGFNIGKTPNPEVNAALLEREPTSLSSFDGLSVSTYLGAIPLPMIDKEKLPLISSKDKSSEQLNKQAGNTFYMLEAGGKDVLTALKTDEKTNQQPLQADPVNQSLLTLISTQPICPPVTTPSTTGENACVDKLKLVDKIYLPASMSDYYKNDVNENPALVSKLLNSNSLITPMLLSTENNNAEGNSNNAPNAASPPPFENASSAQNAAQFIQYVAGTNIPLDMPSAQMLKEKGASHLPAIKLYTTMVRTFAARMSVGLGNLYYILSKRMPQEIALPKTSTEGTPAKALTSQALMEYKMATWRLFNSDTDNSAKQWIEKINTASPATIQKEMAMLLAEINYQLYLTREQQERLLLTNSVSLLISATILPPSAKTLDKEPEQ